MDRNERPPISKGDAAIFVTSGFFASSIVVAIQAKFGIEFGWWQRGVVAFSLFFLCCCVVHFALKTATAVASLQPQDQRGAHMTHRFNLAKTIGGTLSFCVSIGMMLIVNVVYDYKSPADTAMFLLGSTIFIYRLGQYGVQDDDSLRYWVFFFSDIVVATTLVVFGYWAKRHLPEASELAFGQSFGCLMLLGVVLTKLTTPIARKVVKRILMSSFDREQEDATVRAAH